MNATANQPNKLLTAGWDFFTSTPNQYATLHCRVCREPLIAKRFILGPTSWAHALLIRAGKAKPKRHDAFHCDSSDESWHRQALALRQEAERTPSQQLAKLLTAEADEVVDTKTATKS